MSDITNQPDVLIRSLYCEIIVGFIEERIDSFEFNKLRDMIYDHANEQARNEMDIVYKWMI